MLTKSTAPTCLFLDIGGVLLTDGWGHAHRALAARTFDLKLEDLEQRHRQAFDTFEVGRLSLDDYLNLVVFHRKRPFTRTRFQAFMFAQSKPHQGMIDLIRRLKSRYGVKIVVVSNEGRELNAHRVRRFGLYEFVDFFISSCFVHLRKPDPEIFRLALDCAQVTIRETIFIDNSPLHIEAAKQVGIRGILHVDHESTAEQLALLGLSDDERSAE